jgi:Flp pilus assembly protein TadB
LAACLTWAAASLYFRGALKRISYNYRRELEFYLPLVMERLVMAVQSGLDIMAAIGAIVEIEKGRKIDPVTRLLSTVHKLTESGLRMEQALNQVAAITECSALRHAFIHLAVAHKEGGELVMPLKELADSTQLYFQESVEEEIAKLPVKATLPLLLTFAGLIICFITTPIIQILTLMHNQMEVFK